MESYLSKISKSCLKRTNLVMETNSYQRMSRVHIITFFFLIYINYMPDGLKSNVKLCADDTSIFSIVKNKNESAKDLTHDLSLISKWAFQ